MEKKELAVGDSTRLEIILNTGKYTSRVTKSPSIETNEGPPNKRVRIMAQVVIRADSTYPVIIKPYKLDISQFGEKTRDEMTFILTNVSEQDLMVTLVDKPEGYFDLELPPKVEAGKTASGTLKLHGDVLETSFEKSITIQVNDESSSRFTIPVKRTLRSLGTPATTAETKSR